MIRSVEPTLPPTPGPLWVMVQHDAANRDAADRALIAEITTFLEESHLGVWDGESSGGGALDISFAVPNQQNTARVLDRFLTHQYPQRSYAIVDRYEPFFEVEPATIVGCASALLVHPHQQILLQLRDDTPTIACPNMWAIPGGHIEAGETATQAMTRELREELDYTSLVEPRYEYLFWRTPGVVVHQFIFRGSITTAAHAIPFHEGQGVRYFERSDVDRYPIAFGFDRLCRAVWDDVCLPETGEMPTPQARACA